MHSTHLKLIAGVSLIGAIFAYSFGNGFMESALKTEPAALEAVARQTTLRIGAFLMLLNSVFVVIIGTAVFRLAPASQRFAAGIYLTARVLEALLLAFGVFSLLAAAQADAPEDLQQRNFLLYNLGMSVLGMGSLFLFYRLRTSDFLPRWLLLWGMAGYAGLFLGALFDLSGQNIGVWLAIPGGLFELVWGGLWIWLGIRGSD